MPCRKPARRTGCSGGPGASECGKLLSPRLPRSASHARAGLRSTARSYQTIQSQTGEQIAAAQSARERGSGVLKMIDSLYCKAPTAVWAAADRQEYSSDQPVWNPARAV